MILNKKLKIYLIALFSFGIMWLMLPSVYAESVISDLTVTASSYFGQYVPERAVNLTQDTTKAVVSSRWYCTNAGDKWLKVDLKKIHYINRWYVEHLGSAGWDVSNNTKNFELQSSMDGTTWTSVQKVTNNTNNITNNTVTPFSARYVRLYITQGNQNNNQWASVMDFHVYAISPVITSIIIPANGNYFDGQNLDFTVNFPAEISVNTVGGTPSIPITLDTGIVNAQYLSGTGTKTLTFRYNVQSGDGDANGIAIGGNIVTNGGTIRDSAGNDANLTLNGVGNTGGILINAYNVNVGTLIGGSISSISTITFPGATVNLTITPNSGKMLKWGTLKYNDGTDHAISGTSFTMPSKNVIVSAEFEDIKLYYTISNLNATKMDNTADITATISTTTSDSPSAKIISCLYDQNNKLVSIKVQTLTLTTSNIQEYHESHTVPNNEINYKVKIFIIDTLSTLKPLAESSMYTLYN